MLKVTLIIIGFSVCDEKESEVYEELKKFTIFHYKSPLEAKVEMLNNEISVIIPR